jgi:hypothetical protein
MMKPIELPKQYRDAGLRASSFDDRDNTIEVVWTTGATVRRRSWRDGPYDEELIVTAEAVDLSRLNSGAAPFLNAHADWSLSDVIGSVVAGSARIDGGQGFARVKLSTAPADADVVAKIKESVIRNISCGYTVDRVEVVERDGEVPLWRVTKWTPIELSAVPIPADAGAHIRSAEAQMFPAEIGSDPTIAQRRSRMTAAQHRAGITTAPTGERVKAVSRSLANEDGPGWLAPRPRY